MPRRKKNETVTIRSLARDLDTSVCTVSRVLNGKGTEYRIPLATQERILDYASRVDYRPNAAARALRLNRMRDVGLILPDCSNPFFAQVEKFVVDEAYRREYSVSVINTADNTDNEIDALSRMLHRRVEGLVVFPVGIESKHLHRLADDAPPVVLVDRWFPEIDVPQVALDNVSAAELATNYLLDHGHRKIACLQGITDTAPNEGRVRGYRRALAARDLKVDESLIIGNSFTQSSGYQAVEQLLSARPSITAILSLGNQNSLGALRALKERELHVPDDISLVSFDEIEGAEFFATPLTVVAQPVEEMGRRAAELLFESIDNQVSRRGMHELLDAKLIERSSVKSIRSRRK